MHQPAGALTVSDGRHRWRQGGRLRHRRPDSRRVDQLARSCAVGTPSSFKRAAIAHNRAAAVAGGLDAPVAAFLTASASPVRWEIDAVASLAGVLVSMERSQVEEVLYDAVYALTEVVRLTNQPMRQTSSGRWEPDPDLRAALPIDWAEFVTRGRAGTVGKIIRLRPHHHFGR